MNRNIKPITKKMLLSNQKVYSLLVIFSPDLTDKAVSKIKYLKITYKRLTVLTSAAFDFS